MYFSAFKRTAVAVSVFSSFSVFSQTIELEPVVVTATRTPVRVDEQMAAVIVIDRATLAATPATDVVDVLQQHAGLDVGRVGANGQQSSVFIRGAESDHTLVLIDGVRVNPATGGGAALQNISPEMLERIEIVKGPRASLYGSDAIGGVINLITRKAETGVQALLRRDAHNGSTVGARAALGDDKAGASLLVQNIQNDGLPPCKAFPNVPGGFENQTLQANGHAQVAGALLRMSAWQAEGTVQYVGGGCGSFGGAKASQDFRNQTLSVSAEMHPTAAWVSTVTLGYGSDNLNQNQANFLGDQDFFHTQRPSVDWHNRLDNLGLQGNTVSFGLNGWEDRGQFLSFGRRTEDRRRVLGGFVQDQIKLGRHQALASVGFFDSQGFDTQVTYNLEYGYEVFNNLRLSAAVSNGFRAPSTLDRFGFGGNPNLEAEKARNLELAVQWQPALGHTLQVRAFDSRIDNLITVAFSPSNNPMVDFGFKAVNIDETENRGVELSYQGRFWGQDLRLEASQQDPIDAKSGKRLLRRSQQSASLRVAGEQGALAWAGSVFGSGDRLDFGNVRLGGYALVNGQVSYALRPNLRLEVQGANLLNQKYQTADGYNQAGATVTVGVRVGL
jgi:vitamin B12 transporter